MSLKAWFITLLMLSLPLGLAAQIDDVLEEWIEEGASEEAAAEWSDLLMQLRESPANLNDSSAVAALPFISPFQAHALNNYIKLHGELIAIEELYMIPGFDSLTVNRIRPFVTTAPVPRAGRWQWWRGRHTLVTGLSGTVEKAKGYTDSTYEGDNLHALMCYTYKFHDNLSLRLVADKDPTEPWGKSNYYGYHLMVGNMGRLEKLIVGRYNLQFGQGVTLWSGLAPFNLLGESPVRYGAGIRPAATFYESGYQEGLAATVRLGRHWHLSGFGSSAQGERLAGGHIDYRKGNFIAGLTAAYTQLADSVQLRDYVYNQDYFRGDRLFNLGADIMWQYHRWLFYGEMAMSDNGALAGVAGVQLKADSRNLIGISYRHYSPRYQNLHAQAYSISSTRNEQALVLDARVRIPFDIEALLSADLHRFPALRYGSYRPSTGSWLRVQLSRHAGSHATVYLRYTHRGKERNIPNLDTNLYLWEETLRKQWQAEVRAQAGCWQFVTRAICSRFDSENADLQTGWMLMQSARYNGHRLQATVAAAYFNVDGYYARIYLSESNLQYFWNMPMLNGKGVRAYVLLRYPLGEHLTLAGKYALTYYPDQESVGTGAAQTEGGLRQTWFLQMRCHF